MDRRKSAFRILIAAAFIAAFAISLYFLALYPVIKDSERQQRVNDKYASAYEAAVRLFEPYGIKMYSYDEYLGIQKGESDGDQDNYLPLVKPVIMPDYDLGYVIQPFEIQQFAEQADALRYGEVVAYHEPEEYIGRQCQVYDFCLKDDRLLPYYQRLKANGRNDIPFVRLVVDYNSNAVLSASIIFRHRVAGDEEGSMYWAAGTLSDQVINTIVTIYDSRPELFTDYVAPTPEPTESIAPAETTLPTDSAAPAESTGGSISPETSAEPSGTALPDASATTEQ